MIVKLDNKNIEDSVDIEALKRETMESMKEYIENLGPKLKDMVNELRTDIQDDTWEYLRMMIDGFNWVLEAYNGTSSVINVDGCIDEGKAQKSVDDLGNAFINKDAESVAKSIEDGVIPFLESIYKKL